MWVYDLQTLAFLDVNDVACQNYGYTRQEFLSMTIRDIRPPEDIAAVEQSVRLTPAEIFNSGVWRHRTKDGRLLYVEIHSHEMPYRGRAARFVAPIDVTRRFIAEAALSEREAGLRRAQLMARLAHVVIRQDGSYDSHSDTLALLAGCEPADMPRTHHEWKTRFVHPDDRARFSEAHEQALCSDAKVESEYRVVRPDGSVVHVAQVIEPLDAAAELGDRRWFKTLQDVTNQKAAEAAIRSLNDELETRVELRTEQLQESIRQLTLTTRAAESANQAKSVFLSRMSHELKTPLNAVIGFSQLLAQPDHGIPSERQAQFHRHILQAGQHLLTLVGDLLDLATIEAGKVALEMQPLPLPELLAGCEALITTQIQASGLTLRFSDRSGGLLVLADRTRLKQVLLNLLSNAVKYNRPGGQIFVSVEPVAAHRLRISVRDTGAGIAQDVLPQLFEPFNRLGRAATGPAAVEGTGLGLVVAKQLVELMGGRIGVDSMQGSGSTFWIELVATPFPQQAPGVDNRTAAHPPLPSGRHERHTVLLVEDDIASQALVRSMLSQRPELELLVASNGREGVALALAHRPDVILMDNRMPEITGRQAHQLLTRDFRTAGIPIIAISAGGDLGDSTEDRGDALNWFRKVAKPFDQGDLLAAIAEAIAAGDARAG